MLVKTKSIKQERENVTTVESCNTLEKY